MKKTLLALIVACVAIAVSSQTFAQTKTRIGLTAGVDLTTLGSATFEGTVINYNYRPGFQGGLFVEVPIVDKVTFSPRVLYSQKGGDFKTVINGITLDATNRINYLDIPLLFDFQIKSGISLFVGPQVAFFMSQRSTVIASVGNNSTSNSGTGGEDFRKTLIGANLGLGYKINQDIGLKLHYITDLQHSFEGTSDDGERNSGFAFTIGYSF